MTENEDLLAPVSVLLVEDNEGDAILIEEELNRSNLPCRIETVQDGEMALDFLRKKPPYEDAETPYFIILDINMPKMNGLEALKHMKESPTLSSITVFILTTSQQDSEIRTAKELGANGFIVKGSSFALQNLVDYAWIAEDDPTVWFDSVSLPFQDEAAEEGAD